MDAAIGFALNQQQARSLHLFIIIAHNSNFRGYECYINVKLDLHNYLNQCVNLNARMASWITFFVIVVSCLFVLSFPRPAADRLYRWAVYRLPADSKLWSDSSSLRSLQHAAYLTPRLHSIVVGWCRLVFEHITGAVSWPSRHSLQCCLPQRELRPLLGDHTARAIRWTTMKNMYFVWPRNIWHNTIVW